MLADRVSDALRADPVTMEEFGYLLEQSRGGSTVQSKSGVTVGHLRALGLSAWYSGVKFLSETVASLPIHRYRAGEIRTRRADPPWFRPDQEQPWWGWAEFAVMAMLHSGNSFSFKLRNTAGQVVGLREIHPDRVTTGIAPDGTKRFRIDRNEREWTTRDILHIPGLSFDGRFGLNPIRYNAESIGIAAATDDYAGRFFSNGTHLGGVISVTEALTPDEAKLLKTEWDEFHQGLMNAHMTGVLSKGGTYNRLALDADDTQLIESRKYGVTEIARILRIPPHKLYDLERATFSNIEHQSIEADTDSINPLTRRLEAHLNNDPDLTVPGTFVEFNMEGRLQGDTKSENEAFQLSTGGAWRTINEVRRIKNLPPVAGGDAVRAPLNLAPTDEPPDEEDPT